MHLDLDAFFAAVEQRDKPSLRGKPVIVGGVGLRGVVSTTSYEARKFGVGSAMAMSEARRRCPNAAFLAGWFGHSLFGSRVEPRPPIPNVRWTATRCWHWLPTSVPGSRRRPAG